MPVPAKLVGYPPILYSLLRKRIPAIAEAVCPPEFARGVKEVVEKMAKESQKAAKFLEGKSVKKVVYVPGKIISFVLSSS